MTEQEQQCLRDIRGYIGYALSEPSHFRFGEVLGNVGHDVNLLFEAGVDPEDGSSPRTWGYDLTYKKKKNELEIKALKALRAGLDAQSDTNRVPADNG